ncbi:MAG: hypothetical protein IT290_11535 [Deltaproteobacteria bacterium]|nr:hypothetical protein [Deltaproteobacteria bacterium]
MYHTLRRDPTVQFLLLSLVLHLAFAVTITPPARRRALPPSAESFIELVPPPTTEQPKQIVAPSDKASEPNPEAPRLSERDSRTEVETIRRGFGEPPPQPESQAKSKAVRQPREKSPPARTPKQREDPKPKRDSREEPAVERQLTRTSSAPQLRLSDSAIARTLRDSSSTGQAMRSAESARPPLTRPVDPARGAKLQQYRPFSGRQFSVTPGVPDVLPNVQDGEVTLLNAKADKFAVFVRRVALQVFGTLRQNNWAGLSYGEVRRLADLTTVEAVLTAQGKLVEVKLLSSSGSVTFDRIVQRSAEVGSWDQNPPPGAVAEDGKIHFIFKSRTWARRGGEGIPEQRWLLLGTGLL